MSDKWRAKQNRDPDGLGERANRLVRKRTQSKILNPKSKIEWPHRFDQIPNRFFQIPNRFSRHSPRVTCHFPHRSSTLSQKLTQLVRVLFSGIAPVVFARPVLRSGRRNALFRRSAHQERPAMFFSSVNEKLTKVFNPRRCRGWVSRPVSRQTYKEMNNDKGVLAEN
jgi:hypothetical protein